MTECNKCGDCCQDIYIPKSPEELRDSPLNYPGYEDDRDFLLAHFKSTGKPNIYNCDMFDPIERLCTAHEDRPPVCRGYPWYGKQVEDYLNSKGVVRKSTMSPQCSFWEDVPVEIRPKGAKNYPLSLGGNNGLHKAHHSDGF